MTNKLFDDDLLEDDEIETVTIPEDEPLKPFLDKYKDESGLAKAILEKENFINKLKRENAELRVDMQGRSKVEEIVDRLLSQRNKNEEDGGNTNTNQNPPNDSSSVKSLTEEDVQKILDRERSRIQAEANITKSKQMLEETFGADWQKVIARKGKEIGESREFFDAMAAKNPNALLALLGPPQKQTSSQSLFESSVNTTALTLDSQSNTGVRNKKFYDTLKVKDPAKYRTPAIQVQMHKDAIAQGVSFFN